MRDSTISREGLAADHSASVSRRLLIWCCGHAPWLAAAAFFAVMFWPFMRRGEEGEWRRCFLRAAYRLEAREIIHRPDEPNTYAYPPAMAMLAVPLAHFPFRSSLAAWYAVNVAAMSCTVACAWRLIGGSSLARLTGPSSLVFWLGLFLASRFLLAPLENQQFDVVITACLFAGCLALGRGQDVLAALWLGAATAMKCTPLLFAPYLVWRGKLRSAALLVLVAVLVNRVPDYFWPRADGGSYLGDWVGTFLIKVGRTAPGIWDSDILLNQSLSGLINRFVQSGIPLSSAQLPSVLAKLSTTTTTAIRLLTYGVSLILIAITAWRFGRPGRIATFRPTHGNALAVWPNLQMAVEASAIICLMLLLSPMSSKAHYVALLLPCLVVSRAVIDKRLNWKVWLPPLAVLGPVTAKGLTGKTLGDLMLAWGFPTWFVLVTIAALWRVLYSLPPTLHTTSLRVASRKQETQGADTDGATFHERDDDLSLVV